MVGHKRLIAQIASWKYIIFTFISLIFASSVQYLQNLNSWCCNVCVPYFIRFNTDISENGFCNMYYVHWVSHLGNLRGGYEVLSMFDVRGEMNIMHGVNMWLSKFSLQTIRNSIQYIQLRSQSRSLNVSTTIQYKVQKLQTKLCFSCEHRAW